MENPVGVEIVDTIQHLPHDGLLHALRQGLVRAPRVVVQQVVEVVVRVIKEQPQLTLDSIEENLAQVDDILVLELTKQLETEKGKGK